jgi:sigma-B regulation protein RsbQ
MLAMARNNVTVTGPPNRRPMVFVHGLGCDQDIWRSVAPAFEPDHRIVRFDHVGAGGSDRSHFDPAKYGSLHGYAADLLEICHELELEDIVLVGHSAGATIGILAAVTEPARFGALALLGASARYLDDTGYVGGFSRGELDDLLQSMADDYPGWCEAFPRTFMGNADRPELGQALAASFRRGEPAIVRHFAETILLSDHRQDLPDVSTPVLVLQSSEEPVAPQVVGEYVHAHLQDSELVVLQAAGHFPHVSAPAETVTAIHGFLARRTARSEPAVGASGRRDAELQDLYEHAPFGYVSTDLDWSVRRVNQTLLDWIGRDRDELLGRGLTAIFSPAGRRFHATHGAPQLQREGVLREVSIDLRRADGSTMPALISSVVRTDEQGKRTIRTSVLDATQRHGYERKLMAGRRRSERRLRLVQQVVADLAGAGTVLEVARVLADASVDAFGAVAASVWLLAPDGAELVELLPPGRAVRRYPLGESVTETEALRSSDALVDEERGVAVTAARYGARPLGALVLELGETKRFGPDERQLLRTLGRQAGQALDRALANERRDHLLSVVSHELRAPLTPIVGFSELALGRYPNLSEEVREAFRVIKRNGEHLIAVVDDLQNLTRSRRGSRAPTPEHIDLASFVDQLLTDLSGQDVEEVVLRTVGAVAWMDPEHLTQVVTNLLSNAWRHGRPPVRITITVDGKTASLAVEDRGDGVPAGFVDRLFEAFSQAQAGDQRSSAGLGLGLAIARDLMVANDGELAYEPGAGGGARFVVSLPCGASEVAGAHG